MDQNTDLLADSDAIRAASLNPDSQKYYDSWADNYDKDITGEGYYGPEVIAKLIRQYLEPEDPILDIAAGTGLVKAQLVDHGYTKVDALDGSENMLEKAKAANLYSNYIHAFLDPAVELSVDDDTYQGAYCLGAFGVCHLNPTHFPEIFRMIKPGGFLILGINGGYIRPVLNDEARYYPYDITGTLAELESMGKVQILERVKRPYYGKVPGIYYVIKILKNDVDQQ